MYLAKFPQSATSANDFLRNVAGVTDLPDEPNAYSARMLLELSAEGLVEMTPTRDAGYITGKGMRVLAIGYPAWVAQQEREAEEAKSLVLRPIQASEKSAEEAQRSADAADRSVRVSWVALGISTLFGLYSVYDSFRNKDDIEELRKEVQIIRSRLRADSTITDTAKTKSIVAPTKKT